jgi:hypothetical protein
MKSNLSVFAMFVVVLTLVFAVLLVFAASPTWAHRWLDFLILVLAFGLSLVAAVLAVFVALIRFAQHFYDLSFEEAWEFVYRLVVGLPVQPPKYPTLNVNAGRANPDGPTQLLKIGGPGFLSVDHDSAVLTARAGREHRVLGPGFHELEPFERVWDVVDLRLQYREITVEFMTRDGIPASCKASVAFRIDDGGQAPTEAIPFPFTENAVRSVTSIKRMKGWEDDDKKKGKRIQQDWTQRVAFGILDGEVRNCLETYTLNELLHPQNPQQSVRQLQQQLQQKIEPAVRQSAAGIGVTVERVHVSPVQPSEDAVSQEWLQVWQAGLRRDIDDATTDGRVAYAKAVEDARVQATADLINAMAQQLGSANWSGQDVPPGMVVLSFLNILRSTAENDPDIQPLVLQQAKSLQDIVNAVKGQTPIALQSAALVPAAEKEQE